MARGRHAKRSKTSRAIAAGASASTGIATGAVIAVSAHSSPAAPVAYHLPQAVQARVQELSALSAGRAKAQSHQSQSSHEYTVTSGDYLSKISQARCGNPDDWTGIYNASKSVIGGDPDLILPGQKLTLDCSQEPVTVLAVHHNAPRVAPVVNSDNDDSDSGTYSAHSSSSPSGSYGSVNPGSYGGFQSCVIARESGGNSQVMNSSQHYGLYQFSYSTWVAYGGNPGDFGHASVSEQNQVFGNAMATPGGASNWSPYDGCTG